MCLLNLNYTDYCILLSSSLIIISHIFQFPNYLPQPKIHNHLLSLCRQCRLGTHLVSASMRPKQRFHLILLFGQCGLCENRMVFIDMQPPFYSCVSFVLMVQSNLLLSSSLFDETIRNFYSNGTFEHLAAV